MEDIFFQLGNPGRYQLIIFFLLAFNYFPVVFNHVIMAFFSFSPPHICHPQKRSPDANIYLSNGTLSDIAAEHGSCETVYSTGDNKTVTLTCSKGEWIFSMDSGESTIVTEWDLVCGDTHLANLATTCFFIGVMFGGLIFGYVADRYGRKPVMLITLYVPVAIGLGLAFVKNFYLFMVLRFLQGIFIQGLQTSTYVLVIELFSPHNRTIAGTVFECYWGAAVMAVGGIAYFLKNWRHIQFAISLPSSLALCYIWIIPESIRWLHARGEVKKADQLIEKIAKFNKLPNPLDGESFTVWEKPRAARGSLKDVIATPSMRKRSLILFYVWLACNVGYYGLTLKSTGLAGNRYLNFFLGGVLECIAYSIAVFIVRVFGRRKPLAVYFFVGAACCIVAGVMPTHISSHLDFVATAFSVSGKFAMGGLYSVIELYTSELYPTVIRNTGMGVCAFWGRLGGVLAPLFLMLGTYTFHQLPIILFGVATLAGGFMTLLLPETKDTLLPDTVEDVEEFARAKHVDDVAFRNREAESDILSPLHISSELKCSEV